MPLMSFHEPIDTIVFGSSGGIGRAFVEALANDPIVNTVHAVSRSASEPVSEKVRAHTYSATDESSIAEVFAQLPMPPRLILCTIGTLHDEAHGPEKATRQLDMDRFLEVMRINAALPAMVAKHALASMKAQKTRCLFGALSARVGSVSDNRLGGWHSYRASKAALNQLIRTMSIELRQRNPEAVMVGLHPGTVDTDLSKPFQVNVPDVKLFTPGFSAHGMLKAMDGLTPDDSGWCFDYAGTRVMP